MSVEIIREKCSLEEINAFEANQPLKKCNQGLRAVTAVPTENLEIPFGDLQKMFKTMTEMEGDVKISSRIDVTAEAKKCHGYI